MADDINIHSIGGKDPEEMPWAREHTLKQIHKTLDKMLGNNNKNVNELIDHLSNGEATDSATKESIDQIGRQLRKNNETITEKVLGSRPAQHTGIRSEKTSEKDGILGNMDALITSTFATLKDSIVETASTFKNLYENGLVFNNLHGRYEDSILGLQSQLLRTGMSLTTFGKAAESNIQAMNIYGTDSFFRLSGEIKAYGKTANAYAMSTQESAMFTAEYLEQQKNMASFEVMRDSRRQSQMNEVVSDAKDLSEALGMTVKEFMGLRTSVSDDADVNRAASRVHADSQQSFLSFSATMKEAAPEFAQRLNNMMASPEVAAEELAKMVPTMGQKAADGVATLIEQFQNGKITVEQANAAIGKITEASAEYQTQNQSMLSSMARNDVLGVKASEETVRKLKIYNEARMKTEGDAGSTTKNLAVILDDLSEKFNRIIDTVVFPLLASNLGEKVEVIGEAMEASAKVLTDILIDILDPKKMVGFVDGISDFVRDLPNLILDMREFVLGVKSAAYHMTDILDIGGNGLNTDENRAKIESEQAAVEKKRIVLMEEKVNVQLKELDDSVASVRSGGTESQNKKLDSELKEKTSSGHNKRRNEAAQISKLRDEYEDGKASAKSLEILIELIEKQNADIAKIRKQGKTT